MIYFEYDFCTDEAADFAIKRNLNHVLHKTLEVLLNGTSLPGPGDCGRCMPDWMSPSEAADQADLLRTIVRSRRCYRLGLLHQYLLSVYIDNAVQIEEKAWPERIFESRFSPAARTQVGNALTADYIAAVAQVHEESAGERGPIYKRYDSIPTPSAKLQEFEDVFYLARFCFNDDTYRLLEHFTVEQVCELFCINVPPQPVLPEDWARGQDIADVPGNPAGEDLGRTGKLLPYAILHD